MHNITYIIIRNNTRTGTFSSKKRCVEHISYIPAPSFTSILHSLRQIVHSIPPPPLLGSSSVRRSSARRPHSQALCGSAAAKPYICWDGRKRLLHGAPVNLIRWGRSIFFDLNLVVIERHYHGSREEEHTLLLTLLKWWMMNEHTHFGTLYIRHCGWRADVREGLQPEAFDPALGMDWHV